MGKSINPAEKKIPLPRERGEKERNNGTPSRGRGSSESREIKEVDKAHARDTGAHEDGHEQAKSEVVQALETDDLGQNEPWIPNHSSIEHGFSSNSKLFLNLLLDLS